MDQLNALIDCDVARLNVPLRPMFAKQCHNFVVILRRVPADATKVYLRVFRENEAYYDTLGKLQADGSWMVRIPAACFPVAGEFSYEVHAENEEEEPMAVGNGRLSIGKFTYTTNALAIGAVQEVAQLPCEGGGYVQVLMKYDGHEWMPEAKVIGG